MKRRCSRSQRILIAENLRFVKRFVSENVLPVQLEQLRELTRNFSLSLKCGDLLLLSGGWYVTHVGLIRLAKRCHCSGMQVELVRQLSDQTMSRYAFRATVYKIGSLSWLCGLRRRRPVQCFSARPRGRDARGRNPSRQSRPAQGLRHRHLLGRGDRLRSAPVRRFPPRVASNCRNGNGNGTTAGQGSRPPLPDHPPAQARPRTGQGLRRRLLRHKDAPRSHPRAGRKLRPATGRLGREGPQCPALPAQQLLAQKEGAA